MTRSCADLRCLHCGAAVSLISLADHWCEECGKRLPSFFRDAVPAENSRTALANGPGEESLRRQRLLCGGVILALVGLLAFVFVPNFY